MVCSGLHQEPKRACICFLFHRNLDVCGNYLLVSMKLTDESLIKPLLLSGALDERACNRHALCETSR